MISISIIGIMIILAINLPKLIITLFPAKDRIIIKYNKTEKQIKIIEKISQLGTLFFSFINISGYGYKFLSLGLEISFIVIISIIVLINYLLYLRFYVNGRKYENLYDKVIIPYPIGITECLTFLISSILLVNPFVMVFSSIYLISHIFLGLRRK